MEMRKEKISLTYMLYYNPHVVGRGKKVLR
jgi:hypothetical protein